MGISVSSSISSLDSYRSRSDSLWSQDSVVTDYTDEKVQELASCFSAAVSQTDFIEKEINFKAQYIGLEKRADRILYNIYINEASDTQPKQFKRERMRFDALRDYMQASKMALKFGEFEDAARLYDKGGDLYLHLSRQQYALQLFLKAWELFSNQPLQQKIIYQKVHGIIDRDLIRLQGSKEFYSKFKKSDFDPYTNINYDFEIAVSLLLRCKIAEVMNQETLQSYVSDFESFCQENQIDQERVTKAIYLNRNLDDLFDVYEKDHLYELTEVAEILENNGFAELAIPLYLEAGKLSLSLLEDGYYSIPSHKLLAALCFEKSETTQEKSRQLYYEILGQEKIYHSFYLSNQTLDNQYYACIIYLPLFAQEALAAVRVKRLDLFAHLVVNQLYPIVQMLEKHYDLVPCCVPTDIKPEYHIFYNIAASLFSVAKTILGEKSEEFKYVLDNLNELEHLTLPTYTAWNRAEINRYEDIFLSLFTTTKETPISHIEKLLASLLNAE